MTRRNCLAGYPRYGREDWGDDDSWGIDPEDSSEWIDPLPGDQSQATVTIPVGADVKISSANHFYAYPQPESIEAFLSEVYALQSAGEIRAGIGRVLEVLNGMLSDKNVSQCDSVLAKVDVARLKTEILLAFLAITFAGREHLPSRDGFYGRARKQIRKEVGFFSRAASWAHLINPFRAERFSCPADYGETPRGLAVGLACTPVEHSGIFYKNRFGAVRLLHFAGHRDIRDDDPDSQPQFAWVTPPLHPMQIPVIEELCILIVNESPRIEYGFEYGERSVFNLFDGTLTLADGTTGLTCATFVLSILRSVGIRLAKTSTWKKSSASIGAQSLQVRHTSHQYPEDVSRLRREIGAIRYSPSQVAGCCMYDRIPVSWGRAEAAAISLLTALHSHYLRRGLIL